MRYINLHFSYLLTYFASCVPPTCISFSPTALAVRDNQLIGYEGVRSQA